VFCFFSRPDRKLLCSWHVHRSWHQKLNEQQAEVYAALKHLQNVTTESAFQRSFHGWKASPQQSLLHQEGACLPATWMITCKHKHLSGKLLESFHKTLTEIYQEGKQNKCMDHLLWTLRKISCGKPYEKLITARLPNVSVIIINSTRRRNPYHWNQYSERMMVSDDPPQIQTSFIMWEELIPLSVAVFFDALIVEPVYILSNALVRTTHKEVLCVTISTQSPFKNLKMKETLNGRRHGWCCAETREFTEFN